MPPGGLGAVAVKLVGKRPLPGLTHEWYGKTFGVWASDHLGVLVEFGRKGAGRARPPRPRARWGQGPGAAAPGQAPAQTTYP